MIDLEMKMNLIKAKNEQNAIKQKEKEERR